MRSLIAGSFQFLTDILPRAPHRSTDCHPVLVKRLDAVELFGGTREDRGIEPGTANGLKVPQGIASVAAIRMPFFAIAFIYLTLPGLPLLLSAGWLGVWPHGFINLEFLLIGALSFFLPHGVVFTLLCVESLADFAYIICYAYQFSLGNLFSSLRYLSVLPRERVVEGLAFVPVVLLVSAALVLVRPLPHMKVATASGLIVVTALLIPFDILSGQNPLWHKGDVALVSFRVSRSPILSLLAREVRNYKMNNAWRHAENLPVPSASAGAISFVDHRAAAEPAPNVVVIVVESWGLLLDTHLASALTAPFEDPRISRKFQVSYGAVPFSGLTLPGEARELCHSTLGFGILQASSETTKQCMPAYFRAHGYQSIAIHGYVGQMYNRNVLYPNLGFDQVWFGPDLLKQGLPDCRGAFPGTCDTSIASWIGSSLLSEQQPQPSFIYWVTLNSHLPIPANPDLPDPGVCATHPALEDSAALCSWFRLVRAVHMSVQEIALGPTARPTVFLLVGDHAPPFGEPKLRGMFSNAEVPYVLLTPAEHASR
jgi:phosphoglycerol transferase MdoB-like AlkP superfamily enzyme